MANTKDLRKRIKSIQNTAKITHAMELVAAAKMKRAQNQAVAGKPYSLLLNKVLISIANRIDPETHPLLAKRAVQKSALIFFSSDRGLAGSLNSNLFRQVDSRLGNIKFITIGKKARQFVVRTRRDLIADFSLPEKPEIISVKPIAAFVTSGFLKEEFDEVYVLYTHFVSTLKQVASVRKLLPILNQEILEGLIKEAELLETKEPLFEPDADTVLEAILPQYILMELYQILLEVKASEHSARMIAMKNATENAYELTDDLTLTYNSFRQEAITKEILDISVASVALE